jgi:hypothetical protein
MIGGRSSSWRATAAMTATYLDKRRSTGGFLSLQAEGAFIWGCKLLPRVAT